MSFESAWAKTDAVEKGYVNRPDDSGGETNHGVTVAVARAHGYTGAMKDMPLDVGTRIAKEGFWDVMSLDDVSAVSDAVACKLFDMGFLCGVGTASIYFHIALNLFMSAALPENARVGPTTVGVFQQYMKQRASQNGEAVMLRALNDQEGQHFINICRANPKNLSSIYGWFAKRVT